MVVQHQDENVVANVPAVASNDTKGAANLDLENVLRPTNRNLDFDANTSTKTRCAKADDDCNSSCGTKRQGFAPSRSELEKQYVEAQRKRIAEERRRNAKTCYDAIHNPQLIAAKPRELTVPVEFNLGSARTPSRSRCTTPARSRYSTPSRSCYNTPARSECSDMSCDSSIRSCGRRTSSKELTTPRGPNLRTAHRPRSMSRPRFDAAELHASAWPSTLRPGSVRHSRASSREGSRQVSASPARSTTSRNSCMVTPKARGRRTPRHDESCDSPSSDMAISIPPSSVRSRMGRSVDSRHSRMGRSVDSRRSRMGRSVDSRASSVSNRLSTDEIEEIRIAAKRVELKELRKQNEQRGRKAIKYPELLRHNRSVSPLTIPKEFNLSCPATPAKSVISDGDSDVGEKTWTHSLRSVPASPRRTWEPELTVPHGPNLGTARRSRSTSSFHSRTLGQRSRSSSCNRFPREQEAIDRHMERVSCFKWQHSGRRIMQNQGLLEGSTAVACPANVADKDGNQGAEKQRDDTNECKSLEKQKDIQLPSDIDTVDLDGWVKSATCHEERAQRKRLVVELNQKKRKDEMDAKLKCFTGPKSNQSKAHSTGVGRKSQQ